MADMDVDDIISNLRDDRNLHSTSRPQSSAKDDISKLKQLWIVERMSPEIMQFQSGLLDRIMERVRDQVWIIENTIDETLTNSRYV
jgi:GINS complex subunit 4